MNSEEKPEDHNYKLHATLVEALWDVWKEQSNENSQFDPVKFGRQFVIALAQVSAIVGVDTLMDEEQFVAVCRATFKVAYDKAPKFS